MVATLARRQHRAVARRQLLDEGLTRREVDGLLQRRTLHQRHRGVYAVGHPGLSGLGRVWAAVLAVGDGAVVCGTWAAWLHGLVTEPTGDVTIIAPRGSGARSAAGYVVHRPTGADTQARDGLLVTTVDQTLLDLAATDIATADLVRIAGEAFRLGRVTQRMLQRALDAHPRHRGRRRLAGLADDRLAPTRSAAEDELFAAMRRGGLCDFEVNRRTTGPERDAYFPAARLNVEIDGVAFHSLRHVIEADHERDRQGRARGILTLRFTPRQVRSERGAVLAEIRRERDSRIGAG